MSSTGGNRNKEQALADTYARACARLRTLEVRLMIAFLVQLSCDMCIEYWGNRNKKPALADTYVRACARLCTSSHLHCGCLDPSVLLP